MTCTTHHDACDCREAAHAAELLALRTEVKRLRLRVGLAKEKPDSLTAANDLFAALKLDLVDGEPSWMEDSDDPDELRECLRRHRLAAAAERMSHEARAVVADIEINPEKPFEARICVGTPTGDRAHERAVAANLLRIAIATSLFCAFERGFIQGVRDLVPKVASGEVSTHEAWKRIIDVLSDEGDDEEPSP